LILHTNHLPRLQSVDHGVVRRVAIIPFNATISEKDKRTDFAEEMINSEGPAILAWMIDGAVRFYSNHMTIQKPTAVLEASKAYIEGEDLILRYIESNCRLGEGAKAYVSNLYLDFRAWCTDEGLQKAPYGRNQFSRTLQTRYGFQSAHDSNGTCLKGIALTDDDGGI
jgi:phage/plasmid-associated DNA primase